MDTNTKKMIGWVLILLGIAAAGVIGWDYMQYLEKENSGALMFTSWRWTPGEIFQIIAGFISVGVGVFMLNNSNTEEK